MTSEETVTDMRLKVAVDCRRRNYKEKKTYGKRVELVTMTWLLHKPFAQTHKCWTYEETTLKTSI